MESPNPFTTARPDERSASPIGMDEARSRFRRLILYICIAGVVMVIAALWYLSLYGPLTATMVIATTAGVFVSVLLGAGLMAAGFLSSNSGHDERATGRGHSE